MFASLLIEHCDEFVVVARDSGLHSVKYKRIVPVRYPKGAMLAARCVAARCAVSVGDLCEEYPEGPTNKPYRSILAVPLIASDGEAVFAVVSIDSSRPYFFQSFRKGAVENELENTLQPYLQTLLLALENLVSRDRATVLRVLTEQATFAERR